MIKFLKSCVSSQIEEELLKEYANSLCFLVLENGLNNLEVIRIAAKNEGYTDYVLQSLMVDKNSADNVLLLVKELPIDKILSHSDQIIRVIKGNSEAQNEIILKLQNFEGMNLSNQLMNLVQAIMPE